MPYYGLYIPPKDGCSLSTNNATNTTNSSTLVDSTNDVNKDHSDTDVSAFVFENKVDALNVLKQYKDARFKEFLNEEDAIKYAQTGFEVVQNKYNDVKKPLTDPLERAAFKAPTRQQLIWFRSKIEIDDWQSVKKLIWENPRYLVSSGDTPTILKEGYRYNAMHICATSNYYNVAKLILDTVSDINFVSLLLGKCDDEKSCKELCGKLLDYYLNLPEKGRNETPLHLASKFGHPNIVAILLSYPECKMLRNSSGTLARYMICERGNAHLHHTICTLFEERYYVPVLRSNDSAIAGQIGEPFMANDPPNLNCDPLSPEVEIKALAGPMSKEKAKTFFRRWKTPPRMGSNVSSQIANNPFISPMRNTTPIHTPRGANTQFSTPTASLKKRSLFNSTPQSRDQNGIINTNGFDKSILDDSFDNKQNGNHETNANEIDYSDKGEANNNNHLNNACKTQINVLKTSMCPLTPLRRLKNNAFSIYRDQNIDSPIEFVREINDSLLNVSDVYSSPCFKERHIKNTDIEKGLECIGRALAREEYIEWREYWDFLDEFVDISSKDGMKKLENYLAQREREQDQRNNSLESSQKLDILDDVCSALENCFPTTSTVTPTANTSISHQSTTPYTYVEKSLQVHARRMTKTIIHNIDNEVSIIDALLLELRRVKSLIYSFKEDASYINVNFEKVHSRIGNLVSMFLENSQEVSKQRKWKMLVLFQNISKEQGEKNEHMGCVCARIFEIMQHPTEQISPENIKTEEMCSNIWSQEKDCNCQWESNLSRKTSRRHRMEARYKNHQRAKHEEKLQKNLDNEHKVNNEVEVKHDTKADENDSSEEEEFWSDFGGSDSEEDEVFLTPQESPSRLSLSDDLDEGCNKIFIFGNEPTKRDLDVLNAIFHINIDKTKYPNIHSWKSTLMRYSNEEMDFFPSPRTVKKSHSFMATSSNKKDIFVQPQTPTSIQKSYSTMRSNTSSSFTNSTGQQSSLTTSTTITTTATATINSKGVGIIRKPVLQLPPAKCLFSSPEQTKTITATSFSNDKNSGEISNTTRTATAASNTATFKFPLQQKLLTQRPLTPKNKMPGLFSAYRERLDSPLSASSISAESSDGMQ